MKHYYCNIHLRYKLVPTYFNPDVLVINVHNLYSKDHCNLYAFTGTRLFHAFTGTGLFQAFTGHTLCLHRHYFAFQWRPFLREKHRSIFFKKDAITIKMNYVNKKINDIKYLDHFLLNPGALFTISVSSMCNYVLQRSLYFSMNKISLSYNKDRLFFFLNPNFLSLCS